MKKLIGLLFLFGASQTSASIFLRNNYGAPLKYANVGPLKYINFMLPWHIVEKNPDALKTLENGKQVEISKSEPVIIKIKTNWATLDTGTYDATHLTSKAKAEESKHPNENAIITVHGSWNPYKALSWDVRLTWEPRE